MALIVTQIFHPGDRVITYNERHGTVVDVVWDDHGIDFLLVRIDDMSGEYAYELDEVRHHDEVPKSKTEGESFRLSKKPPVAPKKRTTA
ncbi:hypothetical protein [Heliophilum fasciatum]|uniref:Uncharacterized protein n=1 Tax=Heliophilum fasciatum TaxID=35700 RepID=A0A4R2RXF3_9FIRM|nr:hypothetical protein [Heliophilum fasciatum]MCW2278321.1 hypothetical protein [Heliophilum fasciatum]TCP63805.1 hypothetical protein EDD73_11551 [Heliophilum fasciatum]